MQSTPTETKHESGRRRPERRERGRLGQISAPSLYLFATLATALLFSCQEEVVESAPVIRPVRYTQVESVSGARDRTFTGGAKAGVESRISFKVRGTLSELDAKVGDRLKKGHLIARIDPRDYELLVEDAQAALAQARAQAVKAEADFNRVRGLFERDNASQAEYDATRAARDSAIAQVNSVQKKLETAQLQLEYTELRSPIDGAVAEVPVEVNENVQVGQSIVVLNAGAQPEVEVGIPEVLIREIREGARVDVTFDSIPGRVLQGRVTEISPSATSGMTIYPVTIRLNAADRRILPGMAAEVTFRFGAKGVGPRYVVPPHAVVEDRRERFVLVVLERSEGLGVVERRPVVIGELVRDGIEVLEGLEDGDKVVVTGASRVQPGQQVRVSKEHES